MHLSFNSNYRFCVHRARDIQQELDEYTENSAQLEKELEASLEQVEKQNRDLEHQNQRLKNDIETLKVLLDFICHNTESLMMSFDLYSCKFQFFKK